jgi:HPt (histidine-containing phosphotransfer) domain-containing protein
MQVPTALMAKYIENRKIDFNGCLSFYDHHEYEKIAQIGHQLKGNGSTFGHPELSSIGKKLENAAQTHDADSLRSALKDFSLWIKKVS